MLLFRPPFRCSGSTVFARYAVLFLLSYRNSVFPSRMMSVAAVGVLSVAAQKNATGSSFVNATPFPPVSRSPRTPPSCRTIRYVAQRCMPLPHGARNGPSVGTSSPNEICRICRSQSPGRSYACSLSRPLALVWYLILSASAGFAAFADALVVCCFGGLRVLAAFRCFRARSGPLRICPFVALRIASSPCRSASASAALRSVRVASHTMAPFGLACFLAQNSLCQ